LADPQLSQLTVGPSRSRQIHQLILVFVDRAQVRDDGVGQFLALAQFLRGEGLQTTSRAPWLMEQPEEAP
jgi:hypothetical protein